MPIVWIGFLVVLLCTGICYGVFWYSGIQVSEVEVQGSQVVGLEEVSQVVQANIEKKLLSLGSWPITSKSIFLIDKKKLSKRLLASFPGFEDVVVQKKFPKAVTVIVKERQPLAVFCQKSDECFLVDKYGVAFQAIEDAPLSMVVLHSTKEFSLGGAVADEAVMAMIEKVALMLNEQFQVVVTQVALADPLVMTTQEGWLVYFDSKADHEMQLTKLQALLSEEISPTDRQNLHYIYLQYKDRAYYK